MQIKTNSFDELYRPPAAEKPIQSLEIEWREAGYSEEVIKICLASKLVRDSLEQDNEITICQSA